MMNQVYTLEPLTFSWVQLSTEARNTIAPLLKTYTLRYISKCTNIRWLSLVLSAESA